ncbi:MAG: DUF58 domain-containing protein [Planctomycetia bacterium]|jgi:uncharacterized protein (DUF58 family)
MATLFDGKFIRTIRQLGLKASNVSRGGRHAEHPAIELGSGLEFRDYRGYTAGDDFRRIDWNLYNRLGRLFVRQFDQLEDYPVYILVDLSDSMWFATPTRADMARQVTAAVVAAAVNQHDRPQIHPFGADFGTPLRTINGNNGLVRALDYLGSLASLGQTDLVGCVRRFTSQRVRRGMAVIVSDFFDPAGIDAVTDALRSLRHDLLLVQITRASDRQPDVSGEVRLVDCESGVRVDVQADSSVLAAYREAYDQFQEGLDRFAIKRGAAHVQLDVEQSILDQLNKLFPAGVLQHVG